jgi:hypothetical protein
MGNKEINPAVAIAVGVVVLVLAAFFGIRAVQPPAPPSGSYTPGVPPWLEKNRTTQSSSKVPPNNPAQTR